MPDITTITAGLNSLKAAIDITKYLKDSATSLDKAVMDNKLAELYSELAESKMKFVELKEALIEKDYKIKELEDAFESRDALVKFNDAYYKADDAGDPKGNPYCLRCWESDHKQRQLVSVGNNYREKVCTACGHKYYHKYAYNLEDRVQEE